MFEPQKEIEPMIAANRIGISVVEREVAARVAELDDADQRHRAAADAVEQRHHLRHRGHLHAARAPGRRPRCRWPTPTNDQPQSPTPCCSSVAPTAIAMPTAATWLPRTAVRGPRSICSPTMNIEKATM